MAEQLPGSALTVGVSIASYTHLAPQQLFAEIAEIAVAADEAGVDLLAVPDHMVQMTIGGGHDTPMLEAYTLLGALAARTERTLLGAFVTPATFRAPAVLAKTVTTLDVISGGRALLGIGAGVNAEEHHAFGLPFPPVAGRMERLEQTLVECRALFDVPLATFRDGEGAREVRNVPQPVQVPPILIGGGGERFTLPLVARHGDICNLPPAPDADLARKLDLLDRALDAAGRPHDAIRRTAFLLQPETPDALATRARELRRLGFDGVVIGAATATPGSVTDWVQAARSELA